MCVPLDDPGERRRSLSTMVGEDTDMRPHMWDDVNDINVNMIMQEADEQLKNGTISFSHYNTVLKQVSMIPTLISSSVLSGYEALFPQGVMLTTHLHPVLRLRFSGAIDVLPHMLSWYVQRQPYL